METNIKKSYWIKTKKHYCPQCGDVAIIEKERVFDRPKPASLYLRDIELTVPCGCRLQL